MPLASLFNPAGGLWYHLRALRHSRDLWQPFRLALGKYLLAWPVEAPTLLLVGPGGGYCLPLPLCGRFERIVCLEPDPLARLVFSRRLARAELDRPPRLEFLPGDFLLREPARLVELAASRGDCALLFCNVLGQLPFLLRARNISDPRLGRIRQAVAAAAQNRAFASFHDRLSGPVRPSFEPPFFSGGRLSDAALLSRLYAESRTAGPEPPRLLDHLTEGFFPATLPHAYFTWQLEPGAFHVIEAVASPGLPAPARTLAAAGSPAGCLSALFKV